MRTGAQEHFYLETQATIAIPQGEDDEIMILASTQNPTATQMTVASVLGIPASKVVVQVKPMRGGISDPSLETNMIVSESLSADWHG